MTKKIDVMKLFGIITLAAIIGFSMAVIGCDNGDDNGNGNGNGTDTPIASFAGTWNASGGRSIVFSGSNFTYKVNGTPEYAGTFSVSGSKITFKETMQFGGQSASGNFTLSGTTLTLSNHTWDSSVNGTYTKNGGSSSGTAPTVTTTSLPDGTVGTAYSQTLAATGDTPITWSIDTGTLPNGLTLSTAGVISGNPTTANTFNFTVKATNATGSGTKQLSITITGSTSMTTHNIAVAGSDVYVLGYTGSSYANRTDWYSKNGGVKINIPEGGKATKIAVSGTDVYILGSLNNTNCYWKNGTRTNLDGYGYDITVAGSDVYVAGTTGTQYTTSYKACYWKNGIKTECTAVTASLIQIHKIAVSGSDVYVHGDYVTSTGGGVCLWKNGTRTTTSVPTDWVSSDICFAASGSNIYFAGSNGSYACYWRNGTRTNLFASTYSSPFDDITVSGSDVYFAGRDNNGNACYWKNTTKTALSPSSAYLNTIAVSGSDVYVSGFYEEGSTRKACYWKNGIRTDL